MEKIELTAAPRQVIGKQVKAMRRAGIVPVVLYGRNVEPQALQIDAKVLTRVLARAGTGRLITVKLDGKEQMALARDIQREPITGNLYHVDLMAVSMTEKIKVDVPIVLFGESPAVQRNEGVLGTTLASIQVECLPGDLVDAIRVDVSGLNKVDDQILVKDLSIPQGLEVLTPGDETVVRVTPIREEKIEEAVPAAEAPEVEVIEKGKKEEEVEE